MRLVRVFWRERRISSDPYLLQVIELHGYFSEEEVDVRSPLHGADKIRLCIVREKEGERHKMTVGWGDVCVCEDKVCEEERVHDI